MGFKDESGKKSARAAHWQPTDANEEQGHHSGEDRETERITHARDTRFLCSGWTKSLRGFTGSRPSNLGTFALPATGGAGVRMANGGCGCLSQHCLGLGVAPRKKTVW